jgi:hypothetical protein
MSSRRNLHVRAGQRGEQARAAIRRRVAGLCGFGFGFGFG